MDAKIRVMPTCWFLLLRFFVRIDNVIVRAREVRLFHDFTTISSEKMEIAMEVIWREKDLTAEAPPLGGPLASPIMSPMMANLHTSLSGSNATTTTTAMPSSASHHHHFKGALPPPPMMMKKYTKENMQELPIINEREGIPPNYLIYIM